MYIPTPTQHTTAHTDHHYCKMELFRHRFGFLHHTAVSQASPCDRVPTFAHALCRPWHLHGSHALPCRCVSSQSCGQYAFVLATACPVEAYDGVTQRKLTNAGLRAGSTDILHREVWLISPSTLSLSVHATRTILMERGNSSTYMYSTEVLSLSLVPPRKAAPRAVLQQLLMRRL